MNEQAEIINLYHLANTALCMGPKLPSKYERMLWATDAFTKDHSEISHGQAYKMLDRALRG